MKKFSELSEEILAYELAIQFQEGNITEEELHEIAPALVIGGKILGGALSLLRISSSKKFKKRKL